MFYKGKEWIEHPCKLEYFSEDGERITYHDLYMERARTDMASIPSNWLSVVGITSNLCLTTGQALQQQVYGQWKIDANYRPTDAGYNIYAQNIKRSFIEKLAEEIDLWHGNILNR